MSGSSGPSPAARGGPYKGLIPFSEQDAPFFFGRETDREVILANLQGSRLTLLYGASGVGKSSVLQAGVVHRVRELAREGLAEHGAPEVAIVTLSTWRDDPLAGLLRAVQTAVEQAWGGRTWEAAPADLGLAEALRTWTGRLEGNLLILLDQFEDYFLYHPQDAGPGSFAAELARAVNDPDLRVGFLISIREDALAWLDRFKGRIPGLFQNYLRLDHLDREEAARAIRGPVAEYARRQAEGWEVEPALVEEVMDQVAVGRVTVGEAGQGSAAAEQREQRIETPYLQLVMSRIWDEEARLGSRVLRKATLVEALGGAEKIVRTHLDTTLAALSPEEQAVAARAFRYLVTPRGTKIALGVEDLADFTGLAPDQLRPVLEKLAGRDVRILRPQAERSRYEIFHDVLAAAILDWRGRFAARQEQAEIAARFERERRRIRRLRLGIAAMLVLLLGVTALASWAFRQRALAQKQSRIANSSRLTVPALTEIDKNPALALLLSLQANRFADTAESRDSLWKALKRSAHLLRYSHGHQGRVLSVAFRPDGRVFASGGKDGAVRLWSFPQGKTLGDAIELKMGEITQVAFSPDGGVLAAVGADEDKVVLLDAASRRRLRGVPLGQEPPVSCFAFHPRGELLALGLDGGRVLLVDPASGQEVAGFLTHAPDFSACPLAFSPDGKLLAAAADWAGVHLWDVERRGSARFLAGDQEVHSLSFSPDSRFLALGIMSGLRIWDLQGDTSKFLNSPGLSVSVELGTGGQIAVGGENGVRLWQLDKLAQGAEVRFATAPYPQIALSPDGKTLIAGEREGISIWSLAPFNPLVDWLRSRRDWGLSFSPDGRLVAIAGAGGVDVWSNWDKKLVSSPWKTWASSAALGPDGDLLAVGDPERGALLGSLKSREVSGALLPVEGVTYLEISPDGRTLAAGGSEGLRLWSIQERKPLGEPLTQTPPTDVTFSQDGRLLAASDPQGVTLWSLPDRRRLRHLAEPREVISVQLRGDGEVLATAGTDGLKLWSWRDSPPLQAILATTPTYFVALSEDGKTIAAKSEEQVRLWWSTEGRSSFSNMDLWTLPTPIAGEGDMALSPDGKTLALANSLNGTWFFNLELNAWKDRACAIANRNLSAAEWERFLGPAVPYEKTCPDLPPGKGALIR